ncbi:MAG: CHAD domain-containing protein [Gemmatimonadota bacterium]
MSGAGSLLAMPAPEAVRRIALGFLGAAAEASRRLERPDGSGEADAEALHDFRVAVRRLRATLRAYRPVLGETIRKKHERALRDLTRATGSGRDAEVQLAWLAGARERLGPAARAVADRVASDLEAEKSSGYRSARDVATHDFRRLEKRLRRRLRCLEPPDDVRPGRAPAVRSLAAALDRILPAFAAALAEALVAVGAVGDHREAHRARISGKRVRYLLEPLLDGIEEAGGLVDRLKDLQDTTGDLRDLHLLAERVARLAGEEGTEELAARIREEQEARFAGFVARWRGDGADRFFEDLESARARVGGAARDPVEIERKYLLSGRPTGLDGARARELEQGYLPGTEIQERIRRIRDGGAVRHVRSIKLGAGLVRTEVQEEIDPELFDRLWPLTEGRRIAKRRYAAHGGGLLWEVDEFTDRELWLAEVEIPSSGFEPEIPGWLAPFVVREVTDEPEYLNVNLAR